MYQTPYNVYVTFKTIEAEIKNKDSKPLDEEAFEKRVSQKNRDLCQEIADLFNTKFANVDLEGYIRCGFHHFKGFSFDKFFREIVLQEYIARDARNKRNTNEDLQSILKSLKYINKNIQVYLKEMDGEERKIVQDYVRNKIGPTIIVYCIWRNLFKPTDVEWEYMTTIKNNYAAFEKNVIKYAPMLDKWRVNMKGVKK